MTDEAHDLPPDPFAGEDAVVGGPIDSPDVYARGDEDDDLAHTQEAVEAEREERDGAIESFATREQQQAAEREQKRERLGFDLAWWAEDNDVPPIDTVSDLANGVCGQSQFLRALQKHGYPEDAMTSQPITFNHLTGPLVVGALQILGCLHAHLRDEIEQVLVQIHNVLPIMTEEEQGLFADAHKALSDEQYAAQKAAIEASGLPVIDLRDLFGPDGEEKPDTSLN